MTSEWRYFKWKEYEKLDELKEDVICGIEQYFTIRIDIFDTVVYLFSENKDNRKIQDKD